eukprot:6180770-Pleurochrysis_carterae.AAC.1
MCTPGLQPTLGRLASLTCSHRTHASVVGGTHDEHGWQSASHAAYPPDLNLIIAQAIASRITLNSVPISTANQAERPTDASTPTARVETRDVSPTDRIELSSPLTHAESVSATRGAEETDASELHRHFQRGLGAHPLRNRSPAALLTVRDAATPELVTPPAGE